jgi:membrane protease YdiL (CAAX protease family)
MSDRKTLPIIELITFSFIYASLIVARRSAWLPASWSQLPVIETAWLNFLLVAALVLWLSTRPGELVNLGLQRPSQPRVIFRWVIIIMVADTLIAGVATPVLVSVFGETQQISRFEDVPGNLTLLLTILPLVWLIAAFGEEFFFRGFLLTRLAQLFGTTRWAWCLAIVLQAIAFGALHAYQGPVDMILIGIGGLVYGVGFVVAKRNLWPLILAHGINDTVGFVLLYAGVIEV